MPHEEHLGISSVSISKKIQPPASSTEWLHYNVNTSYVWLFYLLGLAILNSFSPQTGQIPLVAGVPEEVYVDSGLETSRFCLHFTQYASTNYSHISKGNDLNPRWSILVPDVVVLLPALVDTPGEHHQYRLRLNRPLLGWR